MIIWRSIVQGAILTLVCIKTIQNGIPSRRLTRHILIVFTTIRLRWTVTMARTGQPVTTPRATRARQALHLPRRTTTLIARRWLFMVWTIRTFALSSSSWCIIRLRMQDRMSNWFFIRVSTLLRTMIRTRPLYWLMESLITVFWTNGSAIICMTRTTALRTWRLLRFRTIRTVVGLLLAIGMEIPKPCVLLAATMAKPLLTAAIDMTKMRIGLPISCRIQNLLRHVLFTRWMWILIPLLLARLRFM